MTRSRAFKGESDAIGLNDAHDGHDSIDEPGMVDAVEKTWRLKSLNLSRFGKFKFCCHCGD